MQIRVVWLNSCTPIESNRIETHRDFVWMYVRTVVGLLGNPMEGVGEDEKAYNYICNLDKVNLGGPGWFNDVFKVRAYMYAGSMTSSRYCWFD